MKNKDKDFYKPTRCIIGIDQSYTCTGFAIYADGNLRLITSENFKGLKTKSLKREKVAEDVKKLIKTCKKYFKTNEITIIVERIRTFSQSPKNSKNLSISFIKAQAALVCTIVDVAYKHEIKVYSVDTRAWKKAILGTSKPLEKHMEHKKVTEDFNKRVWRDEEDLDSTAEMRTSSLQGENRRLPFFYV